MNNVKFESLLTLRVHLRCIEFTNLKCNELIDSGNGTDITCEILNICIVVGFLCTISNDAGNRTRETTARKVASGSQSIHFSASFYDDKILHHAESNITPLRFGSVFLPWFSSRQRAGLTFLGGPNLDLIIILRMSQDIL